MDPATLAVNVGMEGISAVVAVSGRRIPILFGDSTVLLPQVWQLDSGAMSVTAVESASPVAVGQLLSTAPAEHGPRVIEALSALLALVAARARDTAVIGRLVLALPEQWGPRRRALVRQAVGQAGLPDPIVVNAAEATAAHVATAAPLEVGSCLLVCDFGNRTSSVTVLARTENGWQTLTAIPSQATGVEIDEGVLARLDFDDNLREQLTGTSTDGLKVRDQILAAIGTTTTAGHADRAAILLPEPYPPAVVTVAQIEAATGPVRVMALQSAQQAIEAADINPDTIAGAVIAGSAAARLNVSDRLTQELGFPPIPVPSPELAAANGALTLHADQDRPDTLGLLRAKQIGLRHLGAVITPMILGSILLLQIITDARRLLPSLPYAGTYHPDELNAYLSVNAYALAALCAALSLIAGGRVGAAVWTRYDHDNGTPGRHSRQAGRTLAAAAALGLTMAAIFGLLGEALFVTSDATGSTFLRATVLAAIAPVLLAAAIGLLAPLSTRIRDVWADQLHYPATPVILAVVGTMATQAAAAGLPWLTAVDYAYIEAFGGRIGTALLGIAVALTLAHSRLTRLGLATVLGIGGVLVYNIANARLFTFAYLAAVALWWIVKAIRLAIAATPRPTI
ncbi:hypothetical protein [Catellatospora citrea]|uniref:Hsp70 protein n=1 Tax=Catellatospora citrea TaxID=53366 RepID=A0A8J3K7X1_9ACTN|nr:hypothetical protein [Catellatospora citrea]RKE07952.1 hypothetical protein C8E86_2792 [Catellatospora citrea]GIF98331.1 hypothetical protein Cci01nite_34250 [Catellatospora citrea]